MLRRVGDSVVLGFFAMLYSSAVLLLRFRRSD